MKAVIFDLDNTLYDAEQYFSGAFEIISKYLSEKYKISRQEIYKKLMDIWKKKTSMYPHLFDDLLSFFKIDKEEVRNLVKLFNDFECEITPYPDVVPTLTTLKEKKCKLALVTDGNRERQERKVRSLRIYHFFDIIVYAKAIKSKPSSLPYMKALKKLDVVPSETFYVGDNPLVDFEGAKKAGMKTIRILRGEFKKFPKNMYIDFEVKDLIEVLKLLGEHE